MVCKQALLSEFRAGFDWSHILVELGRSHFLLSGAGGPPPPRTTNLSLVPTSYKKNGDHTFLSTPSNPENFCVSFFCTFFYNFFFETARMNSILRSIPFLLSGADAYGKVSLKAQFGWDWDHTNVSL